VSRLGRDADGRRAPNLRDMAHLFEAAEYVGQLLVDSQVHSSHSEHGQTGQHPGHADLRRPDRRRAAGAVHDLSAGQRHRRLAGDALPADRRIQYGKPILDRILSPATRLEDAARTAIVSLDSTIRPTCRWACRSTWRCCAMASCASASSCGWARIRRCMRTSTRTGRGGWNRRWTPAAVPVGNHRTVVPAAGRQPH
jgi:hypothetical protein